MTQEYAFVIYLLMGVAFIFVSIRMIGKRKKLESIGLETEGIVFKLDGATNADADSNTPVIRFVTKDSVWITASADYGLPSFLLKQGQKVIVIYNPDDPKQFMYKTTGFDYSKLLYIFTIAGAVFLFAGIWFAYQFLNK